MAGEGNSRPYYKSWAHYKRQITYKTVLQSEIKHLIDAISQTRISRYNLLSKGFFSIRETKGIETMPQIDWNNLHKLVDFLKPLMTKETRKPFIKYALFSSRCLKQTPFNNNRLSRSLSIRSRPQNSNTVKSHLASLRLWNKGFFNLRK